MRSWWLKAAATLGLAAAVAVLVCLPPRSRSIPAAAWAPTASRPTVHGAYHVHTKRSDGTGSVDEVAAAAAAARADFLILTDHGDATRTPDPPRYVGTVLVIDAVEISTRGGHYVALGLRGPAPYRLGGAPSDVVEDVARLGGFGVAAHPDSPKKSLAWRDWSLPLPAFEWLNADSQWRDESRATLATTLLTYPFRPVESIVALFDRPEASLARWDQLSADGRFLVALAGADAHARLGMRDYEDDAEAAAAVKVPGYRQMFSAFSLHVELDRPPTGRAEADAAALLDAIRHGRVTTVIDGIAEPARFEFYARAGERVVRMGESVPPDSDLEFVARVAALPGTRLNLLRNGQPVAESTGLELRYHERVGTRPGERGVAFRVEGHVPGAPGTPPVPWLVTNPIFVGAPSPAARDAADDTVTDADRTGIDLRDCRIEKDPLSSSTVSVNATGDTLDWNWRLAGDGPPGWVALACSIPRPIAEGDLLAFEAVTDAPARLSVQVRDESGAHRWQQTVYVDEQRRSLLVPVRRLAPVETTTTGRPVGARRLLFVVDWTHGRPGMQRHVVISHTSVGKSPVERAGPG